MRSVQISKKNLINNVNVIKNLQPNKEIMAVLKGNAYGHGFKEVSEILRSVGVNYFCFADLNEAIEARKLYNDAKILVLYGVWDQDIELFKKFNIEVTISSFDQWLKFKDYIFENNLKFHIKYDSGMNRMGFKSLNELITIRDELIARNYPLKGLYTHIAQYEVSYDVTKKEIYKFEEVVKIFNDVDIEYIHFMNSASVQMFETKFDNAVRIGNILWGYYDFDRKYAKEHLSKYDIYETLDVKPILRLATTVKQIKDVKKGEYIGYGSLQASTDIKIIFVDFGKLDGIIKQFKHPIRINSKVRYPLTNPAMNHMFVVAETTDKLGDKIYLYENLNIEADQDVNTRPIDFIAYLDSSLPREIVEEF